MHYVLGDEPTPNIPLLRKVWDWVQVEAEKPEDDPTRQWFQSVWRVVWLSLTFTGHRKPQRWMSHQPDKDVAEALEQGIEVTRCGTAYCFAGYTVEMAEGWQWAKYDPEGDPTTEYVVHRDTPNEVVQVSDAAQELLGLTYREACDLFSAGCGIKGIRSALDDIGDRAQDSI